jgi:hypothetical protein
MCGVWLDRGRRVIDMSPIKEFYYRAKLTDGKWVELVSYTAQNDKDLIEELNNPRVVFVHSFDIGNYIINKMQIVSIQTHHVKYADMEKDIYICKICGKTFKRPEIPILHGPEHCCQYEDVTVMEAEQE